MYVFHVLGTGLLTVEHAPYIALVILKYDVAVHDIPLGLHKIEGM